MRATVVLFDVDGTLVSCGGAGRRALGAAFRERYGRDDVLDFPLGGLTDRAIVRMGLCAAGAADDEAAIDALIARYLELLPDLVRDSTAYRVLPGVLDFVASLSRQAGLAIGLGTGNVRAGAYTKLARADLGRHFAFGGFGCDHEDRAELLAVGARRGAEVLGASVTECRLLVIGDTPRDVRAAHAIGARCLAVATGDHTPAELLESGADHVVPELGAPAAQDFVRG